MCVYIYKVYRQYRVVVLNEKKKLTKKRNLAYARSSDRYPTNKYV